MRGRLVTAAALAAIIAAAAFSVFHAPWYVAGRDPLALLDLELPHFIPFIVALLVDAYFFVRLLLAAMLLLYGEPTSTRTVAWLTPTSAYLQAGASLVAASVMFALPPAPYGELPQTRAWGGVLLIAANVAAIVALAVIARVHALARTQAWVDDDGAPITKKRRWLRSAPAERPLVKAPLESAGMAGGDPFRAAPATGLTALVQPTTKPATPRRDDDGAPAPKLLT